MRFLKRETVFPKSTAFTGGNHRLLCWGLLWIGEDIMSILLTSLTISVPFLLLNLTNELSVFIFQRRNNHFKNFRFCFLFVVISFFSIKTFVTDPGIIPKGKNFPRKLLQNYISQGPQYKKFLVNGCPFQLKFCDTCEIWRAPRTSHCSSCNNCTIKFDHHCPWIGTCIGFRNYRSFLLFITSLCWYLILNIYEIFKLTFSRSRWNIIKRILLHRKIYRKIYCEFFFLFMSTILMIFGTCFSGALFFFHFYLGFIGKTTSELFKTWDKNYWVLSSRKEFLIKMCKNTKNLAISKKNKSMKRIRVVDL